MTGVVLAVTCAPTTLAGGTGGCRYPFEMAGALFLYGAALVALTSFNVLRLGVHPAGASATAQVRCIILT